MGQRQTIIKQTPASVTWDRGLLQQLWTIHRPLPRIQGGELWKYYAEQSYRHLVALPFTAVATILSIAVSLCLLGGFILLMHQAQTALRSAGSDLQLTIFLRSDDAAKVDALQEKIRGTQIVRDTVFTSKEQALQNFRQDLGDRASFLNGLEQKNPLPASLDVYLWPNRWDEKSLATFQSELSQSDIVDEVVFGNAWVEKVQGGLQVMRIIGLLVLGIVVAMTIFLIATTITLVIHARADELNIMRLVGASSLFVKLPFIGAGLLKGFLGAVIGLAVLRVAVALVNFQLHGTQLFGFSLPQFTFLGGGTCIALIMLGALVGASGSMFAVNRFLGRSR